MGGEERVSGRKRPVSFPENYILKPSQESEYLISGTTYSRGMSVFSPLMYLSSESIVGG